MLHYFRNPSLSFRLLQTHRYNAKRSDVYNLNIRLGREMIGHVDVVSFKFRSA